MITRLAVGKHKKKAMFWNALRETVPKIFCLFRDFQVCYFSQENVGMLRPSQGYPTSL